MKFGLEEFIRLARHSVQPASYKQLHSDLEGSYRTIRRDSERAASLYLKCLLNELTTDFRFEDTRVRLPQSIHKLYARELSRIRTQLELFDLEYYDFDNDPFIKDFALLTHRFIPVGAEFAVPSSGVPRRSLFQGGVRQLCRGIAVIARAGGFKPFFALHAHPLALGDFNPRGWNSSYHRLAELLALNPNIKGITSASWFLDPKLKTISPHLSYLREVPEENGAVFLFVEHDDEGSSGALAKSETRKRLFREHQYVPAIYARIWLRGDILKWSGRNKKDDV